MPRAVKFATLQPIYQELWRTVEVTDIAAADAVVRRIIRNQSTYEQAQRGSGIWWPVIAALHNMESALSFRGHLHNGDPLTARTTRVPAGRPLQDEPPFTWAESAADALDMKQTDQIDFIDTPEEALWFCERYNGWGYQIGAGRNTPPQNAPPTSGPKPTTGLKANTSLMGASTPMPVPPKWVPPPS